MDQTNQNIRNFSKRITDYLYHPELWLINENEYFTNDINTISREELSPYIEQLQPWDIVFTSSPSYLSSSLIPWYRKHTLIYIWNWEIIDASSKWGLKRDFQDLSNLKRGSLLVAIAAFRPQLSQEDKEKFIHFISQQIWKEYDIGFIWDDDSYYCSNLISDGLATVDINIDYTTEIAGITAISPENLIDYIYNKWIWNSEFIELFRIEKELGFWGPK